MDSSAIASSALAARSAIKTLESSINTPEVWLYIFVALVVIGVVLEVVVVLWERHEEREDFIRGRFLPQAPNTFRFRFELLGAALVAVGVAGELGRYQECGLQTKLRAKNSELVQLLEGASSAALAIASQNEREAARLTKEAEALRKAAADEQLERIRLELLVFPRRIAPDDRRRIRELLSKFSPRTVIISSNGLDAEAAILGAQIIASLPTTFTIRDERAQTITSGGFDFGIHVRGPQAEQDFVVAISEALRSIAKLQTWANTSLPRTGAIMGGNAVMGGYAIMGGGGGPPGPPGVTAPGTSAWIEVGVKPVETVNWLK